MEKVLLKATDRTTVGKNVKKLRRDGIIPGHVYGRIKEVEHVSVDQKEFTKVFKQVGETGLINLKIEEDRVRPVMVKGVQYNPVKGQMLHIDFYAVNLDEKVSVPVPIIVIGTDPEKVHMGEAIVLQVISEIQVEALPGDLIEHVEVDKTTLLEIDDAITVAQLNIDRSKITVLTPEEEVVIKLAPAVTAEMEQLMEEAAAATEAAQEAAESEAAEGGEEGTEESAAAEAGDESATEAGSPRDEAGGGEESAQNDNQDKPKEE